MSTFTSAFRPLALAALITLGAHAEDKVPLVLTLPKPIQIGTPVPIKLANLEKTAPTADLLVPKGVVNLAKDKKVTSSDNEPVTGELTMITDGDKAADEGCFVELGKGKQWVQIDLGASHPLYAVALWHFHSQMRAYKAVVVQLSDDPDFISGVQTVFNNDDQNVNGLGAGTDPTYVETNKGRVIDAKGTKARYVRCYSAGSTSAEPNHYIEIEVYGTP